MPGIAGFIRKPSEKKPKKDLQLMLKCMMHEKFYTSGAYYNENLNLGVGWVLHKSAFGESLPAWNNDKNVSLFFAGENYRDEFEHTALAEKSSDASYLVHKYEKQGISFLEGINGSFCGLLVDLRKNKAYLFNDRFGLNRLYYHENHDGIYFASEAKAILQLMPELRQLDMTGLSELSTCGCTLNHKTIFSKISLIPGGSKWIINPNNNVEKTTYFNKKIWESQTVLSSKEYYEKLKEIFPQILNRYLDGGQRLGMSLTGGIDTRMIMAWARHQPFKMPCYTFGGMYRDCADVKIAQKVAKACQQKHQIIKINKKFFSEFPALAKRSVYYTDGCMDVSGSVELFINRKAREIAPVRLTGNYGDQILRNVVGFKPFLLNEKIFDPEFFGHMRQSVKQYDQLAKDPSLSFFLFNQLPWHHYSRLALEQTQVTMRSPFLDNDLLALVYRKPPEIAGDTNQSLQLIADGDSALAKIPTDRGVTYKSMPLTNSVRRFYQNFTIKAEYAFDYGMPGWLAKFNHAIKPLNLEKHFLGRHKFYHFRTWYRDELSGYVKDYLLDPRTLARPYIKAKNMEKMVNEHVNGLQNHTQEIHWLLTSELIQRHLIEKR